MSLQTVQPSVRGVTSDNASYGVAGLLAKTEMITLFTSSTSTLLQITCTDYSFHLTASADVMEWRLGLKLVPLSAMILLNSPLDLGDAKWYMALLLPAL